MSPRKPHLNRDKPWGLSEKKRYIAVLTQPCEEHGDHVVTLSSADDLAHLLGRWVQGELPMDNLTLEEYVVSVYSPLDDVRRT